MKTPAEQQQFIKTFRQDLAALCCAGAFAAESHIWPMFVEWLKGHDADLQHYDFTNPEHAEMMIKSVYRMDRIAMLSTLLGDPNDELSDLLDGISDDDA